MPIYLLQNVVGIRKRYYQIVTQPDDSLVAILHTYNEITTKRVCERANIFGQFEPVSFGFDVNSELIVEPIIFFTVVHKEVCNITA